MILAKELLPGDARGSFVVVDVRWTHYRWRTGTSINMDSQIEVTWFKSKSIPLRVYRNKYAPEDEMYLGNDPNEEGIPL